MWERDNGAKIVMTAAEFTEASERSRILAAQNITSDPEARYRVESKFGKQFCIDRWPEAYGRQNLGGYMSAFKRAVQTAKSLISVLILCLMVSSIALAQTTNPGTFRAPTVKTGAVTTSVYWTAGTVNNGGHAVAVAAGSAALGASKVDCTAPLFSTCDILYVDSTGTGAVTTDIFVAQAVGNTILAYIETTAGSVPSNIVLPQQSNVTMSASPTPAISYTSTSAAPGTVRIIRGEATTAATMTSGNLVGVRGAVTMPTGGAISGSYLYGVQGKIITGTATNSGTALAGVYGQIDVTGGTLSAGNNAAVQANIYGANSGAFTKLNSIYTESAGGGIINAHIRMFGKAAYVFDIETNVYTPEANTTCTPSAVTGGTGGIKVLVDGVARWIPLAATCP
jgi:hypothetical protein